MEVIDMKRFSFLMILTIMVLIGCAGPYSTIRTGQGAAIGAGLGYVIGGGKGAAVGAALGGAVGVAVGGFEDEYRRPQAVVVAPSISQVTPNFATIGEEEAYKRGLAERKQRLQVENERRAYEMGLGIQYYSYPYGPGYSYYRPGYYPSYRYFR